MPDDKNKSINEDERIVFGGYYTNARPSVESSFYVRADGVIHAFEIAPGESSGLPNPCFGRDMSLTLLIEHVDLKNFFTVGNPNKAKTKIISKQEVLEYSKLVDEIAHGNLQRSKFRVFDVGQSCYFAFQSESGRDDLYIGYLLEVDSWYNDAPEAKTIIEWLRNLWRETQSSSD